MSFEDPEEERTWVFDVTFLLSDWTCIFGAGCQGVLTEPAAEMVQGCCSYGAHFVDDDDLASVASYAERLPDELWQFASKGRKKGISKRSKDGELITTQAQDACIFLNRPGWGSGPGCALHQAAVHFGERPLDWKPDVCWQLPLRREDVESDTGHVTSTVRQWDRQHWGDGGSEFAWWCTESPKAFVSARPVYRTLRDELVELVGEASYRMVAAYLDERSASGAVSLPHPAVRRRRRPASA